MLKLQPGPESSFMSRDLDAKGFDEHQSYSLARSFEVGLPLPGPSSATFSRRGPLLRQPNQYMASAPPAKACFMEFVTSSPTMSPRG